MMEPVKVSKSVVVDLIRELFDKPAEKDVEAPRPRGMKVQPISANPVVDPMAAVSDPDNKKFLPQNKAEFQVAMGHIDLPEEKFDDLYKKINQTIKDLRKESETSSISTKTMKKDKENKKMANQRRDTQAEAFVRMQVRKILREADGKGKTSLADFMDSDEFTKTTSVDRKYAFGGDSDLRSMGIEPSATRQDVSRATGLSGQSVIDAENTGMLGMATGTALASQNPEKFEKLRDDSFAESVKVNVTDEWLKNYLSTNYGFDGIEELKNIVSVSKNLGKKLSMDEMWHGTIMGEIISQYIRDETPTKGNRTGREVISDWIPQITKVIHQAPVLFKRKFDKEVLSDKGEFKQSRKGSREEIGSHLAAVDYSRS